MGQSNEHEPNSIRNHNPTLLYRLPPNYLGGSLWVARRLEQEMRTDLELLGVAYEYAIHNSTDPSTQNGAVLVHNMGKGRERVVVANGANHFPAGVKESPERWERPAKYAWVEHAERNAIF